MPFLSGVTEDHQDPRLVQSVEVDETSGSRWGPGPGPAVPSRQGCSLVHSGRDPGSAAHVGPGLAGLTCHLLLKFRMISKSRYFL